MFVVVLFSLGLVFAQAGDCPPGCSCEQASWYCEEANITNQELKSFGNHGNPSDVRYLYLGNNALTDDIPMGNLTGFINLEFLDFSSNFMTRFPGNISKYFPALVEMNIGKNNISQVTNKDFYGSGKLEKLNLHGNHIKKIPANTFSNLKNLNDLNLQHNRISEISIGSLGD